MCEVCRPGPGLRRWASHASSGMLWCVMRSVDLLLGCVGGSLSLSHYLILLWSHQWISHALFTHTCICVIIDVLVCEVHRPAPGQCRWVSHIYCFAVVCVRSTDLPVGCVGGSLMHRLIYCIGCDVCEVCRPAPGLRRWASHASSGMLWCVIRSADLLLGCVGGSLSLSHYLILLWSHQWISHALFTHTCICVIIDVLVCEVHRPAPGQCRWVSHIYCFAVVCVRSTDLPVGCVGGSLMHRLIYCIGCDVCEVCRPAPGLRRWASHASSGMLWCVMRSANLLLGCVGGSLSLSHYLILLRCVWGLPICSWVMSVDLSRIYPILFLMCVGSTDLLLGYVGGPLMHRLNFYGVCEVYRPAPGLCRWVSHFSHFNI